MTAESSDQPSPEPGLVPLARPGAHWTPEEQEILVTEVTHAAVQAVLRRTGTPQGHDMGAPP
jgi:hypothetical protein